MKAYIGIWIDAEKAYFVVLNKGQQRVFRIDSPVEDFHVRGGSRSKMPYGPQDNVSESKMLARRKEQFSIFFRDVIEHIPQVAAIHIIGPAQTRNELEKEIRKDPAFAEVRIDSASADSMTTNQLTAHIREYFEIPQSWVHQET